MFLCCFDIVIFFFNDTATTEIYTLSLHDALPIWPPQAQVIETAAKIADLFTIPTRAFGKKDERVALTERSEEHTSELQSHLNLVCRLLLEKKKKNKPIREDSGS